MKCPFCGHDNTRVVDSRPVDDNTAIRRRRMCDECGKRFGGDIKRFAAEGRRGGEHVFGKDLFQRLARVEAFGSDPDIIEALAKIGRGLTRDGAAGGDKGGASERTLAERMYGGK